MHLRTFVALLACCSASAPAAAETPPASRAEAGRGPHVVSIEGERVRLGDLVVSAPEGLREIDLGPSPPPGGSRLIARADIVGDLQHAGVGSTKDLAIPRVVRVVRAVRRHSIDEVAREVAPAIEHELPEGIALVRVQPTYEVAVAPCAAVSAASLPRPPRQKGSFRTVADVSFACGSDVVAHVQVPVTVDVSEQAARPDAEKGSRIDVMVERGAVRISTGGTLSQNGNVGDTVSVLLPSTGRLVRAKLIAPGKATVLEAP